MGRYNTFDNRKTTDFGKEKTANDYSCAMKHFIWSWNKEDIKIAELTVQADEGLFCSGHIIKGLIT